MSRLKSTQLPYRIAAVVVLASFLAARWFASDSAAIAVAAIGIPLIFVFGNYANPDREPWSKVLGGIALLYAFFFLFVGGFGVFDAVLDGWGYLAAIIAWSALLIGVFLYVLARMHRGRNADA